MLADIDPARSQVVAGKLPAGKAEVLQLDVHDKEALVKSLAGVDLVIGLIPEVNLDVMAACLEAGTHYLDMAAAGPRAVGTADVDEELALSDEFKKAGLTGLVFFGIDPARATCSRAPSTTFDRWSASWCSTVTTRAPRAWTTRRASRRRPWSRSA